MAGRKYGGRTDENQREIVGALREAGYHVTIMSDAGSGFPDLVVSTEKWSRLVEVIGPEKAKRHRKTGGLTPAQVRFWDAWEGPPLTKAHGIEEALAACTGWDRLHLAL